MNVSKIPLVCIRNTRTGPVHVQNPYAGHTETSCGIRPVQGRGTLTLCVPVKTRICDRCITVLHSLGRNVEFVESENTAMMSPEEVSPNVP